MMAWRTCPLQPVKNKNEKGTNLMNNPQKREQVLFDVARVINNLDAQFILDDVVQRSGRPQRRGWFKI